MVQRPTWFKDNAVLIVNAATCGINKDGHEQYVVDPGTGVRSAEIDDKLAEYVDQNRTGHVDNPHVFYRRSEELRQKGIFVPYYYDNQSIDEFSQFIKAHKGLEPVTLGDLKKRGLILIRGGHGSPSQDQRVGDVPYIKVSDLRASHVNINPTNMIPESLAREFWGGEVSGLKAYDLISPERASKNIGEFCVLMPGQERVVLTKETICVRALPKAPFDQFYLMWALSLTVVRRQWDRIVFMQTNREDVGNRIHEIVLPLPKDKATADQYAKPFIEYYKGLEDIRKKFLSALEASECEHYIFLE